MMSTTSVPVAGRDRGIAARVMTAGVLVGVLDGLAAVLLYDVVLDRTTAVRIFQHIASGVLGRSAFSGGLATVVLGMALHLTVAHGWAVVYLLAYRASGALRRLVATARGAVLAGATYGVVVWAAMRFVVVALSRAAQAPWDLTEAAMLIAVHMVAVGLPIALVVRWTRAGAPDVVEQPAS